MCAIYICTLCMYVYTVYMCILYIQYMYSMCAREYNVCVCGDLYTGDFEVICGCCSCFFFFSQFIQQPLLTLFSICTTHTHTLTYHTHTPTFDITHISHTHISYHSHHIKLHGICSVQVCMYMYVLCTQ